ncbi:MAG: PAS domain-containing protein [Leptospiraceae bacterium]|nr:PAS domain-containing protein [Leptospiraceae bacterium]MDW7975693.1 PAS domain-containing protein [Leptospiraceae bacterium]
MNEINKLSSFRSIHESIHEKAAFWAKHQHKFVSDDFLERLEDINHKELDTQSIGIIEIDDKGKILYFNDTESKQTGLKKEQVLNKNFFTEVAICTNNLLFRSIFEQGVLDNHLNHLLPYVFTYKMDPIFVKIHLYRTKTKRNFILIKRD